MKKKFSLRFQLIAILLVFVVAVMGLVYFVQTTFLDDFYKANKVKSLQSVGYSVASLIGDDDMEEAIEYISMSNEVCVRIVSNEDDLNYTGACTLRSFDNEIINMIAAEVSQTDAQEKLYDNFHYQRHFLDRPEDVYIFAKLMTYDDDPVMIMVSSGISPLNTTISTIKSQYLLILAIIIVMTLILALILSRYILKPIKQINSESKNLSKGAYDPQMVKTVSLEFDELNETLENANEDILKAEKAKKELLGNVSHDLRTPLTMIVGYGEMIRDLPEENNEENINVIIDEAKRLSTLVDDLIDISKIDAIKLELSKEKVSLKSLLNEVYHQYDKHCKSQGIELTLNTEEEDAQVEVDVKRIKQVLYNFINNSLNYNDKDKQKIEIGYQKLDDTYRVYVYDNGEGIDEKDINNIWDRYYKVDKEHKRHHIGSGIGLSLAKQLLDAHGFNYGVESQKGEWTRFYFDVQAS
ncbi:MAG: HAMP domain-containing histidine kinase [Erysipelotrichaceae bacterium]|nr:HAMP domain-containing histidine kinase [Erysipelotrichaceae bacterium]